MTSPYYLIIWEFQIKPGLAAEFELIYGSNGAWATLFRKSPEYLGTELVRDLARPGRYLTLDRWTSREALQQFKEENANDYAALDQQCERLTEAETFVGEFELTTPSQSAPSQPL
jgi:heme-degrading monooxygenase HmoA